MRLVDVGDVPGVGLDPEAVDSAARGLRADAGAVRDGGADVAGAWAGLGASYEAPEAGQLLRVMDPVRADTDRLADELERVAAALATFASDLREIVAKCDRLRSEVREFRARLAAAPIGGGSGSGVGFFVDSGLGLAPALATENALLSSRIAVVAEELAEAERACAAAIRAVDGPPRPGGFAGLLTSAAETVAANSWGEAPEPETCAGSAINQVGTAMWTGVNWAGFASVYPLLSALPGIGPAAWEWNTAWTDAGRSLIGWHVLGADSALLAAAVWTMDAAEDVVDWSSDQVDALWQVSKDAADWTGDRIDDASDWVGDVWNNDNVQAIVDDWANVGDATAQFYAPFFDDDLPTITELGASLIQYHGAVIGALGTTMAGGAYELNVFDDGEPMPYFDENGDPIPGMRHDADGSDGHPELMPPRGIPELLQGVTDAYWAGEGAGNKEAYIRITTIEPAEFGDPPKVIVNIPGTQPWNPLADGVAPDLTGNLVTAGGGRSTMAEAVKNAIADTRNVPPNAEILLVGHSQGGMAAADLASDPEFLKDHNVTNLVTFGAPVDSNNINPAINTLELQHTTDIVPRLDLGDADIFDLGIGVLDDKLTDAYNWVTGNDPEPNRTTVTMSNPSHLLNVRANHDHLNYQTSVNDLIDPEAAEGSGAKELAGYEESLRKRGFLIGDEPGETNGSDESRVSARDIQVGRKD